MNKINEKEIVDIFSLIRKYLKSLSEDVESEYINNEKYSRKVRVHKWYQNGKDIDGLILKLNNMEAKIIFMVNDAPKWLIRK